MGQWPSERSSDCQNVLPSQQRSRFQWVSGRLGERQLTPALISSFRTADCCGLSFSTSTSDDSTVAGTHTKSIVKMSRLARLMDSNDVCPLHTSKNLLDSMLDTDHSTCTQHTCRHIMLISQRFAQGATAFGTTFAFWTQGKTEQRAYDLDARYHRIGTDEHRIDAPQLMMTRARRGGQDGR